jgi:hypothetical protein
MEPVNPSLHHLSNDCIQRHFVVVTPDVSLLEAIQMINKLFELIANFIPLTYFDN